MDKGVLVIEITIPKCEMTFRIKWKSFIKYNFLPQNDKGCFPFLGGSYMSRGGV